MQHASVLVEGRDRAERAGADDGELDWTSSPKQQKGQPVLLYQASRMDAQPPRGLHREVERNPRVLPQGLQAEAWPIQSAGHQDQLRQDHQAWFLDRKEQSQASRHSIQYQLELGRQLYDQPAQLQQ